MFVMTKIVSLGANQVMPEEKNESVIDQNILFRLIKKKGNSI